MSTRSTVLAARLRGELEKIDQIVARVELLATKARERGDPDYLDGAALNLHGYYAGVERILTEIAREMGEDLSDGLQRHRDVLSLMSSEVPGGRPRMLVQETRDCLDEYCGFRHVVRNIHAFQLRPAHVQALADRVRHCHACFARDLRDFISYLESLSKFPPRS